MSWVEDKRKKCDLGLRNVFWNEDWTGCAWTGKRWVEAEKNGTLVELKEKIMESMIEDFYKKEVETVVLEANFADILLLFFLFAKIKFVS